MLFVADGLRPGMVNEKTAPTMTALMAEGVRFTNTHSLFPTFTTANASGLATGHQLGDTGDFSNNIYVAFPLPPGGSVVAPLENNRVLGEVDQHFGGDYLNEETILKAARGAGFSTAAIGKLGPVLIFDHTERTGQHSVIVDDVTGHSTGIPLSDEVKQRLAAAQLPLQTPARGDNAKPGTNVANVVQQAWLTDVVTKALLPMFKERGKPFVIVFWSRDPDATQHGQGDSPLRLVPGINGPTSLAAIRNADDCLARLMAALKEQGLDGTTDIVLTSDHGFSTISKESATSWAATQSYKDVPAGLLPPGFVAIDLAHALGLKLYEANGTEAAPGTHPSHALIGDDPKKPSVVVAGNGGSDLIYLPTGDKALAAKIVALLSEQDYTSGIFVDDALGKIAGTLPLSAIALKGAAVTPCRPSSSISAPSRRAAPIRRPVASRWPTPPCSRARACTAASRAPTRATSWLPGGRASASVSRAMRRPATPISAARSRTCWVSRSPTRASLPAACSSEALPNGAMPSAQSSAVRSEPDAAGHVTMLLMQSVGAIRYFDAGGYPGRTLGLPAE